MVFQELNLLENMNIAENIFIGREPGINGVLNRAALNRKAKEELKKVNLDISPETMVDSLSCGQKQCVENCQSPVFSGPGCGI